VSSLTPPGIRRGGEQAWMGAPLIGSIRNGRRPLAWAPLQAGSADRFGQGPCGVYDGWVAQVEGVDTDDVVVWRGSWGHR
jgi:hypothetical protein